MDEAPARTTRRAPPRAPRRKGPMDALGRERAAAMALARLLERIADALPRVLRRSAMLVAAARLRRYALTVLPMEDAALLAPILQGAGTDGAGTDGAGMGGAGMGGAGMGGAGMGGAEPDGAAARVAQILRRKSGMAAGQALELAEALEAVAHRPAAPEAEALGFMLRECFDAIARRDELVEAAILPAARRAALSQSGAGQHGAGQQMAGQAAGPAPNGRAEVGPVQTAPARPCPDCACAGRGTDAAGAAPRAMAGAGTDGARR
jgi:hypothetical protein